MHPNFKHNFDSYTSFVPKGIQIPEYLGKSLLLKGVCIYKYKAVNVIALGSAKAVHVTSS